MNTIIIPQKMGQKGDLVILPRKEYESLFSTSSESKKNWVYEKPIAKYVHSRIDKAELEFKKGKATKWQVKKK